MIEEKLINCDDEDPNRCQGTHPGGQCKYLAVEGSKFCQRHGGNKHIQSIEAKEVRQYRLGIWQDRLDEFSESLKIKSLREEIGILRLVLETILNQCKDKSTLVLQSSRISDLVIKIEKLVVSCNRLDTSMSMLLGKSEAINFASQIVNIICEHVSDPEVQDVISNDIIDVLSSLTN